MSKIFNSNDFKKLETSNQVQIITNFFERELANDEYRTLPQGKQNTILNNFISSELLESGIIKPREDGAGFLTRTKFSFADTDVGRKQVLEDEYGKGKAFKVGKRWIILDEKGFNFVDEDSLSWTDAADVIGDIPEELGMMGGAALGTVGAIAAQEPALAVGGASLGAATGKSLKHLIANLLDIKDGRSVSEKLIDIGKSGIDGASAEIGGRAIGKVGESLISKVAAPFANKMDANALMRKALGKKHNIDLTPADILQSPTMSRVENVLHTGFTGESISSFKNKQFDTLQGILSKNFKSISKDSTDEEIGLNFVRSLQESMQSKKKLFNKSYKEIGDSIPQSIDLSDFKSIANTIIKENKDVPGLTKDTAVKLAEQILKMPQTIDYKTFSKIRTNLGGKAKSGAVIGEVSPAQYKRLKRHLDKDFDKHTLKHGLGNSKQEVDTAYRTFKKEYEEGIVSKILNSDNKGVLKAENVGKNIIGSLTNAKRVTAALDGDKTLLQSAMANKLKKDSTTANASIDNPHHDFISAKKLNSTVTKNKDSYDYIYNDAQKKSLNESIELGKITGLSNSAYGNTSGTSKLLETAATPILAFTNPGPTAAALATKYAASKLYTSKVGQEYLTRGPIKVKDSLFSKVFGQPVRRGLVYEKLQSNENKNKRKNYGN